MTVNSIPVSSRIQLSYPNDMASQRFGGIHPSATPAMIGMMLGPLNTLQTVNANGGYITVESELEQA
jgi:hypothetical protein